MHFESKHSYFKRCARHVKKKTNICLTSSKRLQMFQVYLSAGPGCRQLREVKDGCTFYPNLYRDTVKHALREFSFSEISASVSTDIVYKRYIILKKEKKK